jgi:hypothetical protein
MKCDHCGKESDTVFLDIDPYLDEIYPEEENEESYWCDDCYQEALWAI